jgi:hypothetical protein
MCRTYLGLLVKHPYCLTLTKIGMCQQISVNLANMKFNENLLSGSPVFTCRWTGRHGKSNKEFFNFVAYMPIMYSAFQNESSFTSNKQT